ncbi:MULTISPECIES: hypothetical protein [Gordonia]|uniref:hypothetical protein n=1 Tax=Gordonia TaxID=2053 RepID=UPI000781B3BC|nr:MULTISPECIES: hypothetical protein [Gordonia]WFN94166.1 hypothetical protein P5P27_06365 [Gordonia sihwensis]WFN94227.1 hypothetical protein P5P27_06675 [Gordonia sihwensis]
MTQYRLAALEWWEVLDDPTCPECGQERPDRTVRRVRHRRGDIVEVTGSEEARLLAAGALTSLDDDTSAEEPSGSPQTPPADPTVVQPEAPAASAPDKPKHTATRAAWAEYALSRGLDPADVEDMTRAELIEAVG